MLCYSSESLTSQADSHSVQENEKDKKEGHPPLSGPINPTLPEGDNRRQNAVTSCVSLDSFIFPSPYAHVAGLPPYWMRSGQMKIVSHHR